MDHDGVLTDHREVDHTARGLSRLLALFARHGLARVAIERPDGPVVEALLDTGLTVFVVHPRQMKNLRARYGNAGNKDDLLDAFVLADVLRTDWHRAAGLLHSHRPIPSSSTAPRNSTEPSRLMPPSCRFPADS